MNVIGTAIAAMMVLVSGCASLKAPMVIYGGAPEDVALLRIPFNVDIRGLDGNQVAKGLGRDEVTLQIGPGSHKAEVRFSVLYPLTGSNFEKVESDYFIISFDCVAGGSYRVECDDPHTLEDTRRYARKPVFRVIPVSLPAVKPADKAAPVVTAVKPAASAPAPAPAVKADKAASSSELKRVWDTASPAERKAFLDSMTSPKSTMTEPVPVP